MPYGNPDPVHPIKFIKGLVSPPDVDMTVQQGARFFLKLLYEYWGFCVNGTDDLIVPGGFAQVSGTLLPAGFSSGSSLLIAANDGMTDFGGTVFSSVAADFVALNSSGTLPNKYIVTWKPNDPSPDDSVYRIIGVLDAHHIRVDVATGGTTRLGGKAYFSDRSGIRYRVFDPVQVVALSGWTAQTQSLIMNVEAAPNVNAGQLVPQVKLDLVSSQSIVNVTVSPSGSWNGSAFTDASPTTSQAWFSSGSVGQGVFFMIGGRDFLITHLFGEDGAWSATATGPGMHVEVPQRLYPARFDPNPIVWAQWTQSGGSMGMSAVTGSYAQGYKMFCHDGVVRDWVALARAPIGTGDQVHYSITPATGGLWNGIKADNVTYGRAHHNAYSGTFMTSDALLMQSGSAINAQYAMARCRLRRLRLSGRNLKPSLRLGERWVHVGGGVLWPWDGSELPFGLFWDAGGANPGTVEGGGAS